jgi:tetratricopeptide (TPR) repeat protein
MLDEGNKSHLVWGYSILIGCFEDSLREYVSKKALTALHGNDWREGIPEHILSRVCEENSTEDINLWGQQDFLEALNFADLNDILVYRKNNGCIEGFFGGISKERLSEVLIELYEYRNKIAHIKKSSFSELDFISLKDLVLSICAGQESRDVKLFIETEKYRNNVAEIPKAFFQEYRCLNNLPREEYDMEGGFVGRSEEIRAIIKHLNHERPHIVTITGSGGVGKTAVALQVAYRLINSANNPFHAILWFSAKTNKLTDQGIISLSPNLEDTKGLVIKILKQLDIASYKKYRDQSLDYDFCLNRVMEILRDTKCLLIIDNLETRYSDKELRDFLGEIPSPSMILITSRKGLGEYEKRIELEALPLKDSVRLFRLVCKEKKLEQLSKLEDHIIERLVQNVLQYPLLIKWSLGQVYKGREVETAFSKKAYSGDSEIARFSFDDIYLLLSENEKDILFSMVVFGDKPITAQHLLYFTGQSSEELSNSIQQLLLSSLLLRVHEPDEDDQVQTKFQMLSLTRAYVDSKLDEFTGTRQALESKAYKLQRDIELDERARSEYRQSLVSLGVRTERDKIAYQFVKAAKKQLDQERIEDAKRNFESALEASPDFSYALIEYSKYLYEYVNKKEQALELAVHATTIDPGNYHVWWNLGVLRKKNKETKKSIEAYKRASEINTSDAQLAMELGRVYSFDGQYELADEKLHLALSMIESLSERGYPFPKQEAIAYSFIADNYLSWGRSYVRRGDVEAYSHLIDQAVTAARVTLDLEETEKAIKHIRHIHREAALSYTNAGRVDLAQNQMKMAVDTFIIRNQVHVVDNDFASKLIMDILRICVESGAYDKKILADLVNDVKRYIRPGSSAENEMLSITQSDSSQSFDWISKDSHRFGRITYYNPGKKFGKIDSDGESYIFFIDKFKNQITESDIQKAITMGKPISFIPTRNPAEGKSEIATKIEFI